MQICFINIDSVDDYFIAEAKNNKNSKSQTNNRHLTFELVVKIKMQLGKNIMGSDHWLPLGFQIKLLILVLKRFFKKEQSRERRLCENACP